MPNIAIVGGGIGGLCTALALRDHGFDPVVYEAADELRPVGSGIGITPNGMQALDRLDVAADIINRGVTLDQIEIRTADGKTLTSMDLNSHTARVGLDHNLVAIHRAELQAVLANRLPAEMLQLGRECIGVNTDQLVIYFADGTEISADLIIGADGVNSTVRASLFPNISPQYAGDVAYRGLVETTIPTDADRIGLEIWRRGLRFGYFALDDEQIYWFAIIVASSPTTASEMTFAELADRFREFPSPVPELITATDDETLIRTPITELPLLNQWRRGHVTLLGDAAHAMTPNLAQGSSQAMEDAIVLAESISEHGISHHALSIYENRRKSRTESILRQSRLQGRLAQIEHPVLARVRNLVFEYAPASLLRERMESILAVDL